MSTPSFRWKMDRSGSRWNLAPSSELDQPEGLTDRSTPAELSDAIAPPLRNAIGAALAERVKGEVRFDSASRALYATDGSNYRQVPIGVVIPKDAQDVLETLAVARRFGAPVLSRGGGTSLAGQCCNVGIVMDMSKYMNRIIEIDAPRKTARVMPGVILDHLRKRANQDGLTFGPDPSTHDHCTLGGMIGNNSCGVHSVTAGRTSENVHELDIVTYDGVRMRVGATSEQDLERMIREGGRRGEIYGRLRALRDRYAERIRNGFPRIPRRISGYNLDALLPENGFHVARALVGTESTCVTILEASVRLVDWPPCRSLLILGYPDIYSAADHVREILSLGPIGLEALDDKLVRYSVEKGLHPDARKRLPKGQGWLLAEFGGKTREESDGRLMAALAVIRTLRRAPETFWLDDPEQEEKIWLIRESGLGATARLPNGVITWEGWEDSAVPPERLGEYLRGLQKLFDRYGYEAALYGHFGQGCVHTRIPFDLFSAPGIKRYRSFMDEATSLVVRMGGSLSGEHGDGQSKAEFLHKMYGPELMAAFGEFKAIWDPQGKMNPGKLVHPHPIDHQLRLGADFRPAQPKTHFKFPEDRGSFALASLRCVGVGKCRRTEGGVMCPSFMATREEKHSTRGRAHLMLEMLTGDVVREGWQSEGVKEALDLCLSCKGCRKECPVNVDMATYKAEFLSHYYARHPRPRTAYTMGLIDQWARLASRAPGLVNFFTQTPILRNLAKQAAGIAPERKIPRFAERTFKSLFEVRPVRGAGLPQVVLWADTFNNHFHPETALAAVEVLEAAGYQVVVPQGHLCCGRPLYDYGMLSLAKIYLRRVLRALEPAIRSGIPVVGLEPSCVAVFKDELINLFPNDRDAQRLKDQFFMLGDFLDQRATSFVMPRLEGKALVQPHCHHSSVMGFEGESRVLKSIGLEHEILGTGCCGMAGSFGFESEAGRHAVSQKIGERALFPRVRAAGPDVLLIADGFSCRTQIEQATGRRAEHLAEVAARAIRQAGMHQGALVATGADKSDQNPGQENPRAS